MKLLKIFTPILGVAALVVKFMLIPPGAGAGSPMSLLGMALAIAFAVCLVTLIVKITKKREAELENKPIPTEGVGTVIYIVGAKSFLWGLFGFGLKNEKIEKQFAKYFAKGWDFSPFNKRAGKSVLLGLYKSSGWLMYMEKDGVAA